MQCYKLKGKGKGITSWPTKKCKTHHFTFNLSKNPVGGDLLGLRTIQPPSSPCPMNVKVAPLE